MTYLAYSPTVEHPAPDEHVIFDELSRTMQHITRTMASHYRHAYRPVHAKSHGVLTGVLEILPNLAVPFAQGLFATPYQTVATLTVKPQQSYSDARQIFVDEQLSFSPWHALSAHQPLGGIMRSRLKAYEEARKFRARRNLRAHVEPGSIEEVPA